MISLNVIHYHHSTTIEIINNIDDSRDKNVKKKENDVQLAETGNSAYTAPWRPERVDGSQPMEALMTHPIQRGFGLGNGDLWVRCHVPSDGCREPMSHEPATAE